MKYLLLIHSGGARARFEQLGEDEQKAVLRDYLAVSESPGVIDGKQLQPPETATTIRVEDGRTLTTDGPFVEAKEALGGFYLIDANDIDAALDVASRVPAARMGGAVEVRPLVER